MSSPLEASTPIFDENDKNLKRKSINEPDPCSSTKRQKSISINGDETEIDFTLLELRPRKLHDNDLCDGSVIEIDEESSVEEAEMVTKFLGDQTNIFTNNMNQAKFVSPNFVHMPKINEK